MIKAKKNNMLTYLQKKVVSELLTIKKGKLLMSTLDLRILAATDLQIIPKLRFSTALLDPIRATSCNSRSILNQELLRSKFQEENSHRVRADN